MENKHWTHLTYVKKLSEFRALRQNENITEEEAAEKVGIPRTTIRDWNNQKGSEKIPESIQHALSTPDGLEFLHLILTSVQLAITQMRKSG